MIHLDQPTRTSDGWYQLFFNPLIGKDIKKTEKNLSNIEIISFNYDRSLEYVLSNMIHLRCYPQDTTPQRAFETMSKLKIHHVYGRLPALPHEPFESDNVIEYGATKTNNVHYQIDRLYNSKYQLHTCYEEKVHTTNYNDIIFNADTVLMLGFAYHENNMKVLRYNFKQDRSTNTEACYVYGTAYGFDDKPLGRLSEKYRGIRFENISIIEMFKKNYEFLDCEHKIVGDTRNLYGRYVMA